MVERKVSGAPPDPRLARLEALADLLDSRFRVPGTDWRFGIDPLIGLLPGLGDVLSGVSSGWIVLEARRMGVPRGLLARMAMNVALDVLVGAVPVLGSVFDFAFKANRRNLRLLRRFIGDRAARTGRSQKA
jgi:hypothetical protein